MVPFWIRRFFCKEYKKPLYLAIFKSLYKTTSYPVFETEDNLLDHLYFLLGKECLKPLEGASFSNPFGVHFDDGWKVYIRRCKNLDECIKFGSNLNCDKKDFKLLVLSDRQHFDYWHKKLNLAKYKNESGCHLYVDCDYSTETEIKNQQIDGSFKYIDFVKKYGKYNLQVC
jgi:hypothetical protein